MTFQEEKGHIRWNMHFRSSPDQVFRFLATDAGRSKYWAEKTTEKDGEITFHLLNEPKQIKCKILEDIPPRRYVIEYFASKVGFELLPDKKGGTDLFLTAFDVDERWRMEMTAGWVTVLMSLKAAVDFGVDLRNHDPKRTWDQGYADD